MAEVSTEAQSTVTVTTDSGATVGIARTADWIEEREAEPVMTGAEAVLLL
jgi:hypothetical protein